MTETTGPEPRHHLFLTVHAHPVISLGNWANIVEHVKQVILHLPDANWPAMQVYGPTNERFGPGSFCVELTVDPQTHWELELQLQNVPEWFTCPVNLFEVK